MKAIGVVGSPRVGGNTEILTLHALKAIQEEGIETELIKLAGRDIQPCRGCMTCRKEGKCIIKDDLPELALKLKEADAIILSTPVYFGSCTGLMKCFMERAPSVGRQAFAGKVGGPLVVARRAGHNFTFAQMTLWFQILGMYIPGSSYWNIAFGREKGDVSKDEEGMLTAWHFGKNIALLTKKLRG